MRADDGPRPDPKIAGTCGKSGTYQPMRKKGAIILATGGDNSNSAMGKFCTRDAPSPFWVRVLLTAQAASRRRGHHGDRGHDGRDG